jgi:hypothetical protein
MAQQQQPGQTTHRSDASGGSGRLWMFLRCHARSPRLKELALSLAGAHRIVLAGRQEISVNAHRLLPWCWRMAFSSGSAGSFRSS